MAQTVKPPYLASISDWLTQSNLLLRAYPTTTRITSKYTIAPPVSKKRKRTAETTSDDPASTAPQATLTIKTYDPNSGVCLKYRTDQAAEVNRLIRCLGVLGMGMAGQEVDVETALEAPQAAVAPAIEEKAPEEGGKKKKKKKGGR
ncbi:hypothetical protein BT63DRAFT_418438 [Microthyrium microscopicum]|uniref:SRP9 domain-containing protein n=1 Tax=Microthyrium microscopicum TaxID=703497 RepID=A0A6A6U074_9PEZI|nr:hypothetical protein BT63DRAFT_418438 [Microthyrium microscopicum]